MENFLHKIDVMLKAAQKGLYDNIQDYLSTTMY